VIHAQLPFNLAQGLLVFVATLYAFQMSLQPVGKPMLTSYLHQSVLSIGTCFLSCWEHDCKLALIDFFLPSLHCFLGPSLKFYPSIRIVRRSYAVILHGHLPTSFVCVCGFSLPAFESGCWLLSKYPHIAGSDFISSCSLFS
jgi:hypothetical protein